MHDSAAPSEVDAENLQARVLDRLIGGQAREETPELFHIRGICRIGVILPAMNVGHEEDRSTSEPNRLHRLAELFAIPEVALFIKLDEA